MDMYTENNGGFQVLEGMTPFDEGYQDQGADGYVSEAYQETVAEAAYYGDADGAESLPVGQYQETVAEAVYYGGTEGAGNFPTEQYQETAAEYGPAAYMEEVDALPVGPEQMQVPETEDLGMYQDMVFEMEENDSGQTELPEVEDGMAQTEIPETEDGTEQEEIPETEDDSEQEETLEMEETGQAAEPETAEAETAPAADEEDDEETKRLKHEEAEARRKAEWEEKQQAKKAAEQEKLDQIAGMSDDAAVSEAMKRVGADTEKLTRRNMKDCVAEYIQTRCLEDTGFARMVMHPRKNMINCFHYINRKAKEFIQQEMEDNDIRPENGVYGSDVPDDLCYQWAEDYFRDPDAKEDQGEEEKFVPRPYAGKSSFKAKTKNTADKKAAAKKPAGKKAEKPKQETDGQMSFIGQMSLGDLTAQEVKAG